MNFTGKTIKHYEILRPIGKGGMGEVYLAKDTLLDRQVAIKFLPEGVESNPIARGRFLREAKAAAALDHPFICKIYETGEFNKKAYIVMEYVEGKNLKDKLEEGPLALKDALQVALEVAEALEVAHNKGIVHRDLKPANIVCTPQGHAKVMDFGLAKHVLPKGEEALSRTLTQVTSTEQGTIMGTLAYMSPEQARGEEVDGRSDIFSLGIILDELVCGTHPFSRASAVETLSAVLRDPAPAIHIQPKGAVPALSHILHKALEKNPGQRYQKINEFAADVRKLLTEITGARPSLLRRWPLLAAGVVLVALIVTGIWWLVLKPGPSSPAPEPQRVTVLVADFQNLTGDPVFDGGLEQAVTIGLEQASFIDMYRRTEARKKAVQLDPKAGDRLDERLAQLVSRSEGVSVVVNGSIEKTQEGYKLKAWALDPVSSKKIVEQAKNISKKTEVNNEAVKLGGYLSSQIGGVPEESVQALSRETFTTSSVEAMKAYSHAQELSVLGKRQEAIKEYEKAVQEDPNFGRAYAGLAVIYQNSGQYQKAQEYQTKALSLIDRMTEREKYRTRGIWYLLTRNYKKAIEEYSALVEQFPADVAGTSNLALSYFFVRDMAKAVEYGKRRVELNPGETISHYNLSWYHLGAGNFELAEKESLKAMEINPKDEEAFISAALSNLARGNIDLATDYYLKSGPISTMTASLALMGLADIALYEGRLNDAVDILEKGIEADIENNRNDLADDKIVALAQSLLVQGKKDRALQLADKATAMSREADILFPAAQVYIRSGKEEKALALAAELAKKIEPEPQAYAKIIEAEVKKQRKNFREAIALLQEAQQLLDTWIGRFCLGCAYLEAGEFAGAHSEFELCLKRRGEAMSLFFNDLPSYSYLPAVYYYLGRAQEGLKSPAAKDSYQTFLKIKEKDQGDPLVADARKRIQF